jgi:hypothetical protein
MRLGDLSIDSKYNISIGARRFPARLLKVTRNKRGGKKEGNFGKKSLNIRIK